MEPTGCQDDEACPGPPDPRCGAGKCVAGECTVEIWQGPLASQLKGDCKRAECSGTGEVVMIEDPSDVYNDGEQCTYDSCGSEGPQNVPLTNATVCPESKAGECWEGKCVECFAGAQMNNCPPNQACDGFLCVPLHCMNNQLDSALGETDYDCGGPCTPCPPTQGCVSGSDCLEGVCAVGGCMLPTCSDGVHNDTETGVDCGAPSCPKCPPGQGCDFGDDCTSGVCWAGKCEAPSCVDGVRNEGETGIDCGGPCNNACQ